MAGHLDPEISDLFKLGGMALSLPEPISMFELERSLKEVESLC